MAELPETLEDAIVQSREATKAAIADGRSRLLVELLFPELKAMPVAEQFLPLFEEMGSQLKVFFPDTGAAALARRNWGEVPFKIEDLGNNKAAIERKIQPEDEIFLLIEPSAVEIAQVEQLCQIADGRPVVLLLPRLEDAATIGIGYTARQLRDRFLKTLESSYYIRPLEGAAVFRCYPSSWQVWLEVGDDYQLIAEESQKPAGEALDQILFKATSTNTSSDPDNQQKPKKVGLMTNMRRFLRALTQ